MARPKRAGIQDDRFDDPLSDYSPPDYVDQMQRALCETPISDMKHQPFTSVDAEEPIEKTLARMDEMNIACVLVTRDGRLVGILSERDVLDKVADRYEQIHRDPVHTVMTSDPTAVYATDTPAKALAIMAEGGFRHVPILDVDDQVVGIVGPRRVNTHLRHCMTQA